MDSVEVPKPPHCRIDMALARVEPCKVIGASDMADLSAFADASFDLVFHPISNLFAERAAVHQRRSGERDGGRRRDRPVIPAEAGIQRAYY